MTLLLAAPTSQLVEEQFVSQFCFVADGAIHTGMSLNNKLYKLYQTLRTHKKADALALADTLSKQGNPAIVTVSQRGLFYRVWIDLRSL